MVNAFLDFLGANPNTRLLEFLITGREFDYSLTDLAENAGIGWSTLHRILPGLEKQGILIKSREIGRAKLYKLNQRNEEAKKLIEIYDGLIEKQLELAEEKAAIKI
jgi:DNA-binding IclR family transcriptional regulator